MTRLVVGHIGGLDACNEIVFVCQSFLRHQPTVGSGQFTCPFSNNVTWKTTIHLTSALPS